MNVSAVFPDIEIPLEEAIFFNRHISRVLIPKGDFFVSSHTICNKIGFVNAGVLQSAVAKEAGNCVIGIHVKNQFVSVFRSFLSQEKSDWTIQAAEPSHVTVISLQLFLQLCQRHPCWIQFWLRVFASMKSELIEQERRLLNI